MLRLSSVTHAFNMSQYISTWTKGSSPSTLNFSQVAGGLNLRLPSAAAVESSTAPAVAPPGPYMLFILNGSGVPSEAKIVQLAQAAPAPILTLIAVTPDNPTIQTGTTQQFAAEGTYSDNSKQIITNLVTWESSNAAAAISGTGLATGVSAGSTTISATLSGVTRSTVTGSTVLTVQASPAPAPLVITTTSLPDATVNVPYYAPPSSLATLKASGGTQPYTWSTIPSGAPSPLPPGLSLNQDTRTRQ